MTDNTPEESDTTGTAQAAAATATPEESDPIEDYYTDSSEFE